MHPNNNHSHRRLPKWVKPAVAFSFLDNVLASIVGLLYQGMNSLLQRRERANPHAKRILVFRRAGLGDAETSLPLFAAYRGKYPEAVFHVLTLQNQPWQPGIKDIWPVGEDEVIYYTQLDRKLLSQIRHGNYDQVIEFSNYRSSFRFEWRALAFFKEAGIPNHFGFRVSASTFFRKWQGDKLRFAYDAHRLMMQHGFHFETAPPTIVQSNKPILISITGGREMNRWPEEDYKELIRLLSSEHHREIHLLVGPKETLPTAHSLRNISVKIVQYDLRELRSAIKNYAVFIGNDSGPAHLAHSAGVPSIILFSARAYQGMWYYPAPLAIQLISTNVNCRFCFKEHCPYAKKCIRQITPEQVYEKFKTLMEVGRCVHSAGHTAAEADNN